MSRTGAQATTLAQVSSYDALVEHLVLLIRQSAAVQEARADVLLDGAVLAAEQVQDVRLNVLETPAQVSGWSIWAEVALTFLLESNIPGKVLSELSRRIVGQLVKTNTVFLALPKSISGRELAATAKALSGGSMSRVLQQGLPVLKLPGLSSKDALKLYHSSIQLFVTKGSDGYTEFLNAAIKAANEKRKAPKPSTADPIPVSDSAAVEVLSAAQDYARASRLGIRFRHAALESYVRRGAEPNSLAIVAEAVGWDPLTDEGKEREMLSLTAARNKYRLLLEALIWSRMYDFREAPPSQTSNPMILQNQDSFQGISDELQQYWRGRFQEAADQYAAIQGKTVSDKTLSLQLRRYFAAISYEVTRQASGGGDLMTGLTRIP
jgi:hypothetical protein